MQLEIFAVKILFLLFFSFLFSGTEPAFFSLTTWKLLKLRNEEHLPSRLIVNLSEYRNLVLTTILIGNETVNILTSSLFAKLKYSLFPQSASYVSLSFILMSTVLLLLVGEVTPKIIALKKPVAFLKKSVFVVYPLSFLLTPVRRFLKNNGEIEKPSIIDVIHVARKEGAIDDFEAYFYECVFKSRKIPALFAATPVNKVKDKKSLKGELFFEKLPLSKALEIMINKKTSILTVDESGAVSGIITKKDIIKFFTFSELSQFIYGDNEFSGEIPVALFEYYFDVSLGQTEFKTLNGYVFHLFGRLPEEGEEISDGFLKFKVLEVENKIIKRLVAEKMYD